jgi:hypothetical protein
MRERWRSTVRATSARCWSASGPHLVIDAAGPFQGSDYRVPSACIAAAIPYLDLADARDFVCGIGALDSERSGRRGRHRLRRLHLAGADRSDRAAAGRGAGPSRLRRDRAQRRQPRGGRRRRRRGGF